MFLQFSVAKMSSSPIFFMDPISITFAKESNRVLAYSKVKPMLKNAN